MLRFAASRLARALLSIAMVVSFAFIVLRLSGDPAQIIMGSEAPPEAVAAFRAAWGLDEPIWVQYFRYFGAILDGDLGRSMRDGRAAITLVTERIPATLPVGGERQASGRQTLDVVDAALEQGHSPAVRGSVGLVRG
jgi:peptide/nickel transport system permease protein